MAKKAKRNRLWKNPLPEDWRALKLAHDLGITFDEPIDHAEWVLLWANIGHKLAQKELRRRRRGGQEFWDWRKQYDLIRDLLEVHKDWSNPPSAMVLARLLCSRISKKYGIYAGEKLKSFADKRVLPWKRFLTKTYEMMENKRRI